MSWLRFHKLNAKIENPHDYWHTEQKKSLGMKQVNNTEIFKLARKNNVIKAVTRLERA